LGRFGVLLGVAHGLANQDKQQQGKTSGQGGDDGNQGFFGFGLALGRLGGVEHLDDGVCAAELKDAGNGAKDGHGGWRCRS